MTGPQAYPGFKCLDDRVLCPLDGRCPRCTAAFNLYTSGVLRSQMRDAALAASEVEAQLRALVREMLADESPDFERIKMLEAAQRVLE